MKCGLNKQYDKTKNNIKIGGIKNVRYLWRLRVPIGITSPRFIRFRCCLNIRRLHKGVTGLISEILKIYEKLMRVRKYPIN